MSKEMLHINSKLQNKVKAKVSPKSNQLKLLMDRRELILKNKIIY